MPAVARSFFPEEIAYMKEWACKSSTKDIAGQLYLSHQHLGAYMKNHGIPTNKRGARLLVAPDPYVGPSSYVRKGIDTRFFTSSMKGHSLSAKRPIEKPWSIEQSFENPILLVSATAGVMVWRNSGKGDCL